MNTEQPPTPEQNGLGEAHDEWDRYTETLQPSSADSLIIRLHKIDQPYRRNRAAAVAHMKHYATGDPATADRIRQELLPRYAAAIQQMKDVGYEDAALLVGFAELRQEGWRSLADALSENDTDKLEQHDDVWERSESLLNSAKRMTESPESSTKVIKNFQQALSTFTPRLIATPLLVLANILLFATMSATGAHILNPTVQTALDWGANFGPATTNGQWWRVVTCMFLHFGIIHLGFNMWVLWDLGRLVERLVGNAGFLILYFVSGVSGSLASLSWHPVVVSGGASGAVFGVVGALLGLIAFRRDTIPIPVLKHLSKSMMAFLVYNTVFGVIAPGIDMAAHIGGLIAGLACGLILSQPLTRDMVDRRKVRNAVIALAGGAVSLLWAFSLPNSTYTASPPRCTDPKVVRLLEQMIRSTPLSMKLRSIGSHRELSYDSDKAVRQGECVAHTDEGPVTVQFVVEWQDSSERRFQVRILPTKLPECTDPMVESLLEQILKSMHPGIELKGLHSHREILFDSDAGVRYGECVADTDAGKRSVRYVVEDTKDGSYQVRIPPDELPSCTDAEVVKLLEQVIRDSHPGMNIQSIDGHRELDYDETADARHGECTAYTDAGQFTVNFIVEWQNRPKGIFQIQLVVLPQ
ncbi:MAG: rhomboid family intramembrane serine protease [Planctomycetota bacterium]